MSKAPGNKTITHVAGGGPAAGTIIKPGDSLVKINGHAIGDILDYLYYAHDENLFLELRGADGKLILVRVRKAAGADPGLMFEEYLMDEKRSCANRCIFCFIDQLPPGMRESLHYKDDDFRLSFLQGNYVTLTNLTPDDAERIARLRISPINVSVHTLDPELRAYMLGIKNGDAGVGALIALASAGIALNCQIVCCPGINDGAALKRAIDDILELGESVQSVSIVPVGLTDHRQGLTPLRPFEPESAISVIELVDSYAPLCLKKRGTRLFFCADEFYIKAGLPLPPDSYYESYPQLENGVGMMRLFIMEFMEELRKKPRQASVEPFAIVTGTAAGSFITNLLKTAAGVYGTIRGSVEIVENDFFGRNVSVSGLLTGADVIKHLKDCETAQRLLIPANMLRRGEDVFLDDISIGAVERALGAKVRVVRQDGADFLRALLGE